MINSSKIEGIKIKMDRVVAYLNEMLARINGENVVEFRSKDNDNDE